MKVRGDEVHVYRDGDGDEWDVGGWNDEEECRRWGSNPVVSDRGSGAVTTRPLRHKQYRR